MKGRTIFGNLLRALLPMCVLVFCAACSDDEDANGLSGRWKSVTWTSPSTAAPNNEYYDAQGDCYEFSGSSSGLYYTLLGTYDGRTPRDGWGNLFGVRVGTSKENGHTVTWFAGKKWTTSYYNNGGNVSIVVGNYEWAKQGTFSGSQLYIDGHTFTKW